MTPRPDDGELELDRPEAQCILTTAEGEAAARCSLWWSGTPPVAGRRTGFIGHFAARSAEAACRLLDDACRDLALRGCALAIGPVDGSTWRRYRFITERGRESAYFMEPDNPDEWPGYFLRCGFEPIARYTSALVANLDGGSRDAAYQRWRAAATEIDRRVRERGVRLRPLDPHHLLEDLKRIYAVSAAGFRGNFLYTPIDEAEFLALYRPLLPLLRPDLVLIAEQDGRAAGFVFALPDLLQALRGQAIDTVIVKSLCVVPEWRGAGLGTLLMSRIHDAARDQGHQRAIHALMNAESLSRRISGHSASLMRGYALFGKVLRP